eukprot:scaffold59749_cov73-Phaeocystis_antarctica.AAC.2
MVGYLPLSIQHSFYLHLSINHPSVYLSTYLSITLSIRPSAGDRRAPLPQCGEPHTPHGLPARAQRRRVMPRAAHRA